MDLKRTSYDFHQQLESPFQFARRERRMLLLCAGLFSIVITGIVFFVDPAFFYPRLSSDPLNYVLKAQHFLETGNLDARWAVNLRPFAYVSMPGMLRLPAVAAFPEFDHQLRAMQLLNVPIVAAVAAMSAYVFSWVLPKPRHSLAIAFAFAFTLISPVWLANIFLPLADAPYAAFTLAAVLVAIELLTSQKPISSRLWLVAIFVAFFTVSFLLRFTAPVLLLFVAPLALARWQSIRRSSSSLWIAAAIVAIALVLLVFLNSEAIFGRYFNEPISFLKRGEKPGMLLNLFGAALPTQILPTFQLGFVHPPIVDTYSTSFSNSARDMAWAGFGCLLAAVIAIGIWTTRDRLLPESLYVLGALPILTLMMPSTTRYLMPYQGFFWAFFFSGAAVVATRHAPWLLRLARSKVAALSVAGAVVGLVIGLRVWKTAGTASERVDAVTVNNAPAYINDVGETFRSLRNYLETLPADRTLLIGARGTIGRWKAISGLNYIYPDSTFIDIARDKNIYMVVECGTLEGCQSWEAYRRRFAERVKTQVAVELDSVFATGSGRARAQVLRVRVAN